MKFTITFFLLLFGFGGGLMAQCVSGDCQNGTGIYIYNSGAKYVGQFKNNLSEGIGSCYYTDGSKYQGEWADGKPNGEGAKLYPDGRKEEGQWRNGRLVQESQANILKDIESGVRAKGQTGCISGDCHNGKGIYIYKSGAVYVGEFRRSEIHGIGVCYYTDGSKFQGEWEHGYPSGRGTKTYPDHTRRTGLWKLGRPIDENGNVIDEIALNKETQSEGLAVQSGCIRGNCDNGEGVFAYPDGSRYEGNFRNGKPNFRGTFYYPNGDKYVGEFKDGFRHGDGRLYHADGKLSSGHWREGDFLGVKNAEQLGCIKGDCSAGYGTYVFRDGARYIGQFKNSLPHGSGVVHYQNGEKYEGEMANGSFNGFGTLYLEDGSRATGYWRDGTYLGPNNPYEEDNAPVPFGPRYNRSEPNLQVWAVIIGVSSYNHMPVLRYPDDDAYRIYAFLKSPEGGALSDDHMRILIDEDATKQNIKNTMKDIYGKAGPNDLVLLYFSGHGLKGAFLPIDFDGVNNKLFHDEINAILDRSPAKYKLCIADACHSGSLLAMRGGKEPNVLSKYYESLARARSGTALIMSSKSDETSLESSGLRQGVFSHFLIRGLKGEADDNDDKVVTVEELFHFVYTNVRAYTGNRQSPILQGDYDKDMTVSVRR